MKTKATLLAVLLSQHYPY